MEFRIGDAVTRDINNPKSTIYRVMGIEDDILICLPLTPYYDTKITLYKSQVEVITPYPRIS